MIYLVFNPSQDYEFLNEGTENAIRNLQYNFVEANSPDEAILKCIGSDVESEEDIKEYFCIEVVEKTCKVASDKLLEDLRIKKQKIKEEIILEKERQEFERLKKKFVR
jgi:GTP-dependent phosphoenolpyruvate carboxykinase